MPESFSSSFDASSDPASNSREAIGPQTGAGHDGAGQTGAGPHPFLGIRFQCCRTYGRIYRNRAVTAYEGRCPKCQAKVTVPIGDGGVSSRFFTAQ
ncbi:MAG: hypothetical protein MI861_08485 [Pirellulales bacterium]|nr:hypothetical protein [Pirellulales bacterium]